MNNIFYESYLSPDFFSASFGALEPDIAFVFDKPPKSRAGGTILSTPAMQLLRKLTDDYPGKSFYATSLARYYTGTKPPNKKQITEFYPRLLEELNIVRPKRIVAMGSVVSKLLAPGFTSTREDHGSFFFFPPLGVYVIPSFYLSSMWRSSDIREWIINDVRRTVELPDPTEPEYYLMDDWDKVKRDWAQVVRKSAEIYIDIETDSLDHREANITQLGIALDNGIGSIWISPSMKVLKDVLAIISKNRKAVLVGHNLAFDLAILSYRTQQLWTEQEIIDTLIVAHGRGENVLSLKHLTSVHTERPGARGFGGTASAAYLAEDLYSTRDLLGFYRTRSSGAFTQYESLLFDIVRLAVEGEIWGVHIDREEVRLSQRIVNEQLEEAFQRIISYDPSAVGINFGSPAQVAEFLLRAGVPLRDKTDAGNFSTAEGAIAPLAEKYPVCQALLDFREASKHKEFIDRLWEMTSDDHPYVHPKTIPWGADTGRTSQRDPNFQNQPRIGPTKRCINSRWRGGKIGLVDLSSAEVRGVAILSGDHDFASAVANSDAHRAIASLAFGIPAEEITSLQRKKAKAVTFGLLYGGGVPGIARKLGVSEVEIQQVFDAYFNRFPVLMGYINHLKQIGREAQTISTPMGKIRDLVPFVETEGFHRAERQAINTPIQGGVGELTLFIWNRIADYLDEKELASIALYPIHDSVVLDIYPGEEREIAGCVQLAFEETTQTPLGQMELSNLVPFEGELVIGDRWSSVESTHPDYSPDVIFAVSSHWSTYQQKEIIQDED